MKTLEDCLQGLRLGFDGNKEELLGEPKDSLLRHRKARLCMVHEKLSKGSGVPRSAIV